MNRLFCPDTEKGFPIYILWMSTRTDTENISPEFWTANHVVPLVLASLGLAKEPKIGDFVRMVYNINKKRCTWIALMIPAPEGVQLAEGEFELQLMREQKRGYYVFPTWDDLSVMSLRED